MVSFRRQSKAPGILCWLKMTVILALFVVVSFDMAWVCAQTDDEMDDHPEVLVKEIVFFRPFKSPETQEWDARRSQLAEMIASEKRRLETAQSWVKKNIEAHINWLEQSLKQVNKDISISIEENRGTLVDIKKLQQLTDEFKNTEMTLEDMNRVADMVTMAYQENGYILARAYVPEQEIKDGVLKIAIVEGNIDKIDVVDNKYYNKRVLKRYFEEQQRHGVVNEELLERGLLMTNDMPSVDTRVTLKKGKKPGTVDMSVHAKDKLAVKWGADYNNFGTKVLSRDRFGTYFDITDPWWGSTLSLRGVTGTDFDASTLGSADLSIPVNSYGTRLSFGYVKGLYAVGQELEELGLDGDSEVYGFKVSHPILRKKNMNLNLTLGWDHKYTQNYILDELRSIDEAGVFHFSVDFDNVDRFLGKNIVSLGYRRGEVKFNSEMPASRLNVDKRFESYAINIARIQRVYGYTNFLLRGTAQFSNDRLLPMEQMVLGGYGTVRGHKPTLFLGDYGYTVSGELMSAPPFIADKTVFGQRIAQMVQLAIFFDHGGVYNMDAQAGEHESEYLSGYGAGIRLFYKNKVRLKFDVAFPTTEREEDERDKAFYYIMLSLDFF